MPNDTVRKRRQSSVAAAKSSDAWIDRELAECDCKDERLRKRFRTLLEQLSDGTGESISMACQDLATTEAAYQFLSDERVSKETILAGHCQSTRERFAATEKMALVLHDTTEFSHDREDGRAIGLLSKSHIGTKSRPRDHKVCGILIRSSLAATPEGLPWGLSALKFWTRQEFQGTNALKKHINPTHVPIEEKERIRWLQNLRESTALLGAPDRCIHIGDRESDIYYELFCAARDMDTHFVLRTCVDRLTGDGNHTIDDEMEEVSCKGLHRIEVQD